MAKEQYYLDLWFEPLWRVKKWSVCCVPDEVEHHGRAEMPSLEGERRWRRIKKREGEGKENKRKRME